MLENFSQQLSGDPEKTKKNRAKKARNKRCCEVGRNIFNASGAVEEDLVVVTLSRGRDPLTGVPRPTEIIEGVIEAIHETYFLCRPVDKNDEIEQYFFKNLNEIEIRN